MMYTYFIVFYQQCFSSKSISHTESWLPLCTFCWNFYISLSFHLWTKYVWKHHRNIVTITVSINEKYMVIVAFNLIFFHSSFRTNYYLAMHSLWYMWNVFERRVTCACLHRCLFLFSFYKDMYMRLKYKWTQNGYPLLQCFLFHCTSLTKCLTSDSMADCSLTKYLCCGQI